MYDGVTKKYKDTGKLQNKIKTKQNTKHASRRVCADPLGSVRKRGGTGQQRQTLVFGDLLGWERLGGSFFAIKRDDLMQVAKHSHG